MLEGRLFAKIDPLELYGTCTHIHTPASVLLIDISSVVSVTVIGKEGVLVTFMSGYTRLKCALHKLPRQQHVKTVLLLFGGILSTHLSWVHGSWGSLVKHDWSCVDAKISHRENGLT